ncbi:MAG: hypothetical protein EBV05_00375 [Cyanobacteria bacterium WB6_1B_304]|nr:hypothetical protein [Cyanobacteria bacterium WB6_1B_304]
MLKSCLFFLNFSDPRSECHRLEDEIIQTPWGRGQGNQGALFTVWNLPKMGIIIPYRHYVFYADRQKSASTMGRTFSGQSAKGMQVRPHCHELPLFQGGESGKLMNCEAIIVKF